MSSAQAPRRPTIIHTFGQLIVEFVQAVGDLALFAASMLRWLCRGLPRSTVVTETMYEVGVRSIPVVLITGMFIGMVLAVQGYQQFHLMRMETRMGAVINMALVAELGPVLAATMLAGRVGSAMAAQLGTMRVTEQIDALRALGANPIQYLVVPRFLACFLLIPLLTAIADAIGVAGGWMFSTQVLGVDSTYYWHYSTEYVAAWDVFAGILKSMFFGAAIALIACHRGFNCGSGAEGVGQAATSSFVLSFVVILVLDFFLGMFLNEIYWILWPGPSSFV
ncbi:MAG: ABC transporter permease [Planctomycetota bacterium]|nr:ABC transporter permease [Planctomycetota bacterium]MDA0918218.1 ABC transporter permease [Planctomycetota bacterium]